MSDYFLLLGGIVCAAVGGELFLRGVVGIARWLRVSPGIVGATFAAFATSSPELSVSVNAALSGTPQIALGDALGSNVVNIALIMGLALLFAPLHAPRDSLRRDFPVALLVPVLTAMLAKDGVLSRVDGALLLGLFVLWLVGVVKEARRQRNAAGAVLAESRHGRAIFESLSGLILLVAAGRMIVLGAEGIATAHGIDPFLVGATLVAFGTSAPELATVIVSRLRKHDEVGLGTVLGSNIFNGFFIVAVAALLHPIPIHWEEVSIGLLFGVVAVAIVWPKSTGLLERQRGWLLLALYGAYVVALVR
ncbi:MAG: calcium/sodium antiporter [Methylophilaceae bacterium]|nr:calcium/sodium antiporter [Methylophilaceae bacterium]